MISLHRPTTDRWTVDALEELPADMKCEIHDGRLVVMAPAKVWHQEVAADLRSALRAAGRFAVIDVGIHHKADDVRVPDVAVFRRKPDPQDSWHGPETVELVVEVWSPSSHDKDHYNMQWYADRGIPEYWLAAPLDGDDWGARVTQYRLVDGAYVEAGETTLAELNG